MKHLKTFENFNYQNDEPVNEIFIEAFAIGQALIYAYPIYCCCLDMADDGKRLENHFNKIKKVFNFFKSIPKKITNLVDKIKYPGFEEEAKKWITENLINNEEIKRLKSSIEGLQDYVKNSPDGFKKEEAEIDIMYKKSKISKIAQPLFDKLKSENPPLYRTLIRVLEELGESSLYSL